MDNRELLVEFDVPIYFITKKRKMLLGFNQVKTLHKYTYNSLKKWYHALVAEKVHLPEVYDGQYHLEYQLWYEHARVDPSNVICITEKFALDALQECGIINNDNVKHHLSSTYKVMGADKENPRISIKVFKA